MTLPAAPLLSLSIVSHGQAHLVKALLADLALLPTAMFEVILTINIPEDERALGASGLPMRIIRNTHPKGFGANHNAAFLQATGEFFAVVNPDIRIHGLDLGALTTPFGTPDVAACAPIVMNPSGGVEDSARRFPTWLRLARRVLTRSRGIDYSWGTEPMPVDWLAGMFIVFRRTAFEKVGRFDDRRFFMYYEDVDICDRLRQQGWTVLLVPGATVVHDAQRASHRNWRHMRWHVTSVLRYLTGW